jgi:hypothetical protein
MPLLKKLFSGDALCDEDAEEVVLVFYCPGCRSHHSYRVKAKDPNLRPVWTWNNNMEKPSFTPSLMVNRGKEDQCHLFVTDGEIRYLGDCHHEMKGKTIPLPECEW